MILLTGEALHSASLIILVLSHTGRWIGGTDGTVSAQWLVPNQTPPALLVWELFIDSMRLDGGSIPMNAADRPTNLQIRCPRVRVRATLELRYRLMSPDGRHELGAGSVPVHAFPDNLTDGWSRLLSGKSVAVVDATDGLPALLASAHVRFDRAETASELQLVHPDLVLVGADRLDDSPFSQGFVINQARAGAGVMIFAQSQVSRLTFCAVVWRARPGSFEWNGRHPLLAGLTADDLKSWTDDLPPDVLAVRPPGGQPVVPIAAWPGERPGTPLSPGSDLLVLSQSVGRGRIVLCQLRLGSWQTDPRTVLLVGNALDYLSSRPAAAKRVAPRPMPTVQVRIPIVPTPAGDDR